MHNSEAIDTSAIPAPSLVASTHDTIGTICGRLTLPCGSYTGRMRLQLDMLTDAERPPDKAKFRHSCAKLSVYQDKMTFYFQKHSKPDSVPVTTIP